MAPRKTTLRDPQPAAVLTTTGTAFPVPLVNVYSNDKRSHAPIGPRVTDSFNYGLVFNSPMISTY